MVDFCVTSPRVTIRLLLFDKLAQLDLAGPFEVFARLPEARVELVAKTLDPIHSAPGNLQLSPTATFADAPQFDVLMVPGGSGVAQVIEDEASLVFLSQQAAGARYVTAVCTGALVLGAAGLLEGYQATTHWLSKDLLTAFGAVPAEGRVVIDRNRVTGGGVTAGIDFGLTLAAELFGEETAKEVQLMLEYDPQPPFNSGSPRTASAELVAAVRTKQAERQAARRTLVERVSQAR